jgi:hypothetical protein
MIISGQMHIFNEGDTAAILQRHQFEVLVGEAPPARPSYAGKPGQNFVPHATIQPGASLEVIYPTDGPLELDFSQFAAFYNHADVVKTTGAVMNGGAFLFLVGWIEYTDLLKQTRRKGFCRRWSFTLRRFEPYQDPDYEYGD